MAVGLSRSSKCSLRTSAGSIFGFARVSYGLWASILLHMLHNATFVAMVFVGLSQMS